MRLVTRPLGTKSPCLWGFLVTQCAIVWGWGQGLSLGPGLEV